MTDMTDMTNITNLDEILEKKNETPEPEEVKKNEEAIKAPRPFVRWTVGGEDYRLKLRTQDIMTLEQVLGGSVLDAVVDPGIPPLTTTVTVLQAALQKFHHGMTSSKVAGLLDEYFDEGKTQAEILKDVLYPLLGDAGFFTATQLEEIRKTMEEALAEL